MVLGFVMSILLCKSELDGRLRVPLAVILVDEADDVEDLSECGLKLVSELLECAFVATLSAVSDDVNVGFTPPAAAATAAAC